MTLPSLTSTSIVLVGAGNLATHLGKALFRQGFHILQVYSRTEASARSLAEAVEAPSYTTSIEGIVTDAAIYIAALKDDALMQLRQQLTEGRRKALWLHTAGSLPLTVWEGCADRYGVLYPMQTFSKQREVDFRRIPIFWESLLPEDGALLQRIASRLSQSVYEASSEQRKQLHLAAVLCCNFTNHLYALAAELLQRQQLPFEAMLPLIDETARKVHELSPHAAQTGPAVRYDRSVIDTHLQMLQQQPDIQQLYQLLTESIHRKAETKSFIS